MHHYPVEIFWSEEDEGFVAVFPDLPGCSAWGKSEEEALRASQRAVTAWIEACQAAGNPVPEPSRPADQRGYSGRFVLRVPKRLHADLARDAKTQGVSLNQYLLYLLTERGAERRSSVH
jgi:predicted RNase H-like HicB family nuclease